MPIDGTEGLRGGYPSTHSFIQSLIIKAEASANPNQTSSAFLCLEPPHERKYGLGNNAKRHTIALVIPISSADKKTQMKDVVDHDAIMPGGYAN